jgi:hypothetical protein
MGYKITLNPECDDQEISEVLRTVGYRRLLVELGRVVFLKSKNRTHY